MFYFCLIFRSFSLMHYKRKLNTKVQSTSFYLDENLLYILDEIARLEVQSRSIIVERMIYFFTKGEDAKAWKRSKKFYKKKKKIYVSQSHT
ncbi:CopG family transcriptional regulator [Campylobacter sp. LR264d]|nr:CopG family transcriptional regulator [Campylobacter sp. LR264d]